MIKLQASRLAPAWSRTGTKVACCALAAATILSGCGPWTGRQSPATQNTTQQSTATSSASDVQRVVSHTYDAKTQTVDITVRRVQDNSGRAALSATGIGTVEDLLNVRDADAVTNFATAMYPDKTVKAVRIHFAQDASTTTPTSLKVSPGSHAVTVRTAELNVPGQAAMPVLVATGKEYVVTNHGWVGYHSRARISSPVVGRLQLGQRAVLVRRYNRAWYEIRRNGRNVYITTNPKFTHTIRVTSTGSTTTVRVPTHLQTSSSRTPTSKTGARIKLPPPGVYWATNVRPRAGRGASVSAKTNAVLSVARSKIGTKYIWGHNEDRGQYGFDCSNYTEYVYHHALGYRLTTSSRGQYKYVGVTVPRSKMRPGDLLIFEKGRHVGIYAGHDRMIQEGGGLGKCGYLSLGRYSYWGKHLTAVRRMY